MQLLFRNTENMLLPRGERLRKFVKLKYIKNNAIRGIREVLEITLVLTRIIYILISCSLLILSALYMIN